MVLTCPRCDHLLEAAEINVSTDVAVCRHCNNAIRVSEHLEEEPRIEDFAEPPPGTWTSRNGSTFEVGATTRSPVAFFLVPFMVVWSGLSLGGLYGSQLAHHHFSLGQSIFGVPFLLGTVLLGAQAVMAAVGSVRVRLQGDALVVTTGVGGLAHRQKIAWSSISTVKEGGGKRPGTRALFICGSGSVEFGGMLTSLRRRYILGALRRLFRESHSSTGTLPYRRP